MVLPLARSGAWAGSALALTVAGMVTNQNTAPASAASTSNARSNRRIGRLAWPNKHDAVASPRRRRERLRSGPALLLGGRPTIRLVAVAASLADGWEGRLELVDRIGLAHAVVRGLFQSGRLGLEIGLVLPDLRQRRGVGAGRRR